MTPFFPYDPIGGDPLRHPRPTHAPLTLEMLVMTRLFPSADHGGTSEATVAPMGGGRVHPSHLLPGGQGRIALDDPGGYLVIDSSLDLWRSPAGWPAAAWRGRLHGRGIHRVAPIRIEIESAPWSTDLAEVRLRPRSRHATRWGDARLGRYLELADAAVEHLAALLSVRPAARRNRPHEVTTCRGSQPPSRRVA